MKLKSSQAFLVLLNYMHEANFQNVFKPSLNYISCLYIVLVL